MPNKAYYRTSIDGSVVPVALIPNGDGTYSEAGGTAGGGPNKSYYRTTIDGSVVPVALIPNGDGTYSEAGASGGSGGGTTAGPDPATTSYVSDEFYGNLTSTGNIGALGWTTSGGSTSLQPSEANHPGIITKSTGATSGTNGILMLGTNADTHIATALFTARFIFRLTTNDANTQLRLGVMNNTGGATPTDGIYLEKLDADTTYFLVSRAGTVQTRSDTTIPVTATWAAAILRRISSSSVGLRVGATMAAAAAATEITLGTNLPTALLVPIIQIRNSAAASKTIDIDFFSLTVDLTR